MKVHVTTIVSSKDFGTIFGAQIADPGHPQNGMPIRVKAPAKLMLGQPAVGELWEVGGVINDTPWGQQINAQRAIRVMPTGKLIVSFLAAHAPGVGHERAAALWQEFGHDLDKVLSDESRVHEIARVIAPDRPNLAPRLAVACVKAWKDSVSEANAVAWLALQGVEDLGVVRRVCKILGDGTVSRLSANPYCLVPLLPWSKVDALGRKILAEQAIEVPTKDVRRLLGACDAVVKAHLSEGHTAGTLQSLTAGLVKLLKVAESSPLVSAAIDAGMRYQAILMTGNGGWRAPGCAVMEEQVSQYLKDILDSTSSVRVPDKAVLERQLAELDVDGRPLHSEQRNAVLKILLAPLACLQGGAGVGKTTTTQTVCDLWERCGGKLVLTAIAGKAALRLSRTTGRLALTVARLRLQLEQREAIERELATNLSESARAKLIAQRDKLIEITPSTLVVIDEASMLDLASANALFRQMPRGARLLLVGDEAQLPPVGFGLIYHRLVSDDVITARLTVIHRQTEASGIPAVSGVIRSGQLPVLPSYVGPSSGVSMIECSTEDIKSTIQRVWHEINSADGTLPLVVTPTNDHNSGIHALNAMFHSARLHEHCAEHEHRCREELKGFLGQWFSIGDPVVFLKNDYSKGLFNGLLGTVVAIDVEAYKLLAQFDGYDEPHELEQQDLFDLQLAYAITCHRAQGSQAPAVIVPLYRSRVLDPSWIYTAVTRAERQVVLIGTRAVLEDAMSSVRVADRRMVGFSWIERRAVKGSVESMEGARVAGRRPFIRESPFTGRSDRHS